MTGSTTYIRLSYTKWNFTLCPQTSSNVISQFKILQLFPKQKVCKSENNTQCKKATIHQVTTMLATSETVLFPGHNHLLTTGTDDCSGNNQSVWPSVLLVSRWLGPWNRTFLEVASMVVTWWIVAFCSVKTYIKVQKMCQKLSTRTKMNHTLPESKSIAKTTCSKRTLLIIGLYHHSATTR